MRHTRSTRRWIAFGLAAGMMAAVWGANIGGAGAQGVRRPVKAEYVPGQVLVKFKAGLASADAQAAALGSIGATQIDAFDSGAEQWKLPAGQSVEAAVAALRANPSVEYAEPNYLVHTMVVPNDPRFGELYGLRNTAQTGGTNDADIDADDAWNTTTGSRDILVAVIDTGVDHTHPDLAANIWTNWAEDPTHGGKVGVDDDGNGFVDDLHGYDFVNNDGDPMDDNQHGTHVSGTIGAVGNNGIGVAGVNWQVSIMGLKFLDASGSGSNDNAIRAIDYATKMGVRFTSNSWGGGPFSQAMFDSINRARTAGIGFIAAAGNSNSNNDNVASFPASYNLDNIISVGATDNRDARASFSNFGRTTVDVGAPGVNTLSTVPGGGYGLLSGTSMATPHVSGAIALMMSADARLTFAQARARLFSTVDVKAGLTNLWATNGRINVNNAIAGAPSRATTVSAASFKVGVAAESLASTFGTNMATGSAAGTDIDPAPGIQLPTSLLGTSVTVTDSKGVARPAPLLFVSPGQINLQIPSGSASGGATVVVNSGTGSISVGTTTVVPTSVGLFSASANGSGLAAANLIRRHADGSDSFESVDGITFAPGDTLFLALYGTAIRGNRQVSATIGGVTVPVLYAGDQGTFVGLDQINLGALPTSLAGRGSVNVIVTVDGNVANTVTVRFA